jgi:hypothetical protein
VGQYQHEEKQKKKQLCIVWNNQVPVKPNMIIINWRTQMSLDESDWERMYGKTPAVYEETKMIEIQKNYKLTLTEQQARKLYKLYEQKMPYYELQAVPSYSITSV